MRIQQILCKSFLVLSAIITASCSNSSDNSFISRSAQEITINIQNDPTTLDPRKARIVYDFNAIRMFNEGLYRLDVHGKTIEGIADSCIILEDNKTHVFKLKETLWSNGDALTAHDFVYAWKSALNKDFPAPCSSFLFCIRNAKDIKDGLLPASLLGVTAKDDFTLVVELCSPLPYFKELLCNPIFFPVNESIDQEHPKWSLSTENYVCNGPFKLAQWKHKDQLIAEKNDRYHDKYNVNLSKINMVMVDDATTISMYKNKELSWAGSPYSKIPNEIIENPESVENLKVSPFLSSFWLRANVDSYPLNDSDFRKSLASAIDRSSITKYVLSNTAEPTTGIVPRCMGLQDGPYFKDGDIAAAKKSLQKACENLNAKKDKLPTITLTYSKTTGDEVPVAIQDQLRKSLGIQVKLEPLEIKVYIDRISKGDYQLAFGNWIADFNDPINFLEVFKTKNVGTNNTNWESLNYISAIEASYNCGSVEDRVVALQETEQLIIDEMPVIPLYNKSLVHMQRENLKDVLLTNTGILDFKWAYISD